MGRHVYVGYFGDIWCPFGWLASNMDTDVLMVERGGMRGDAHRRERLEFRMHDSTEPEWQIPRPLAGIDPERVGSAVW